MPYVQLDDRAFAAVKLDEPAAEEMVAAMVPGALDKAQRASAESGSRKLQRASVRRVYTKVQVRRGNVPDTEEGRLILHSYSSNGGWWVMLTPGMDQVSVGLGGTRTGHYTPYSYDRHVPLAFFGAPFVPGTYLEHAEPVDIAATFAALLRVNRPSACVGRVVTEALRPERAVQRPHAR